MLLGRIPLKEGLRLKPIRPGVGLLCRLLGLAAPLCEEPLFRGVFQGTYEKRRPAFFAISIPALMAALSNFQLSGLAGVPALLSFTR